MTYKEIINRIRTVVEDHRILQDFGYGQLSDLKTQSQLGPEEQGVDYPYLFLLPQTHQRQGSVMNYTFNMIVMDVARDEEGDQYDNYITIQSDCQQYIDDVLSQLYYFYSDQPEVTLTGISYNPFKEKYQDELAGMTATITVQVPTPLNNCIAPFEQILSRWGWEDERLITDNGEFEPFIRYSTALIAPNNIKGDDPAWDGFSWFSTEPNTYEKVEVTFKMQLVQETGNTIMTPPSFVNLLAGDFVDSIAPTKVFGWPTEIDNNVHHVTLIWEDLTLNGNPEGITSYVIASPLDLEVDEMSWDCTNTVLTFY
jgi:hypothetical protein